jgi:hypothetical protein
MVVEEHSGSLLKMRIKGGELEFINLKLSKKGTPA